MLAYIYSSMYSFIVFSSCRKVVVIDLLIIGKYFPTSYSLWLYNFGLDERDGKKVELHEMVISAMKIRLLIWTKAWVYF